MKVGGLFMPRRASLNVVMNSDIRDYNASLADGHKEIADHICELIAAELPDAVGRVWHGNPVWFIDSNPIVGYSLKKHGFEVLFWSGQSFSVPGLRPIGKFKAAGIAVGDIENANALAPFLSKSFSVQWNYRDLPKLRMLQKLTDF